uniref:C-type lectin domain-containing protein n=1 Tax=Amphiprion percula TaxID=161767 RepID=A0A3P8SNT4_AMPPE
MRGNSDSRISPQLGESEIILFLFLYNWHDTEPNNNGGNANSGFITSNGIWFDRPDRYTEPFYCVDVTVEEEKMSWEDALSHCREKQTHLPSLLSETDRLLAQTEIKHSNVSELVWIGLRFLGDCWMWVNGDPLEYEAWSKQGGQDHQYFIPPCGEIHRFQQYRLTKSKRLVKVH